MVAQYLMRRDMHETNDDVNNEPKKGILPCNVSFFQESNFHPHSKYLLVVTTVS